MERAQRVKNAPFAKSPPRAMNVCGDSLRAASGRRGQREKPTAARALLPMSRQARGLGRIFRPRSRDKRTGEVTEYGEIDGVVFSRNIRDTSSTTIDTNTGGNASINYNCGYVRNPGGQMPQGYTIEPGTYKELADY